MLINNYSQPATCPPKFGMAWARVTEETAHNLSGVLIGLAPSQKGSKFSIIKDFMALAGSLRAGKRKKTIAGKILFSLKTKMRKGSTPEKPPEAHIIETSDTIRVTKGCVAKRMEETAAGDTQTKMPIGETGYTGYVEFKLPTDEGARLEAVQAVRDLVGEVQAGEPYRILKDSKRTPLGVATKGQLDQTYRLTGLGHNDSQIADKLDTQPRPSEKSSNVL